MNNDNQQSARCPRCRQRSKTPTATPHAFYCHQCKMEFDASGDDGEVGYGRPEKVAERHERLTAKERQRRISEGLRLSRIERRKKQ